MHKNVISSKAKCQTAVVVWLVVVCAMVFAMVVLGGAVRLTGSGLSMVEWQPILGILPPFNEMQWQIAFDKYRAYPEYQIKNKGMSLADFQFIFYMEYFHRLFARMMALVFLIGIIVFSLKSCLTSALRNRLIFLFFLGGLQGLMGWLMVKSGLVDNPHVSALRLTAHLLLAFIIYVYFVRLISALTLPSVDCGQSLKKFSTFALILVLIMIASGGMVAGTKAGFIYNTFPTMHGQWIPDGILSLSPWWLNVIENPITVQWAHRLLAVIVFVVITMLAWRLSRQKGQKLWALMLFAALCLQVFIGILTLINRVPLLLGVLHQAGALVLIAILAIIVFRQYPLSLKQKR